MACVSEVRRCGLRTADARREGEREGRNARKSSIFDRYEPYFNYGINYNNGKRYLIPLNLTYPLSLLSPSM